MTNHIKNFIFLLTVLIGVENAVAQPQEVHFEIEGLSDSIVTLGYYFGDKRYVVDTLEVNDGKFVLEQEKPLKKGIYFLYSTNYYFEFLMDSVDYRLSAKKDSGYKDVNIEGSKEGQIFKQLRIGMEELQAEQRKYMAQMKQGPEDSVAARESLLALEQQAQDLRDSIQKAYPHSFTAAFIGLMKEPVVPTFELIDDEKERSLRRYRFYKDHFLDEVALGDSRLLRTPIYHTKVLKYFDEIITQHPDSINKEIDMLFEQIGDDQELFRYWLITLFQKYEQSKFMGMDAVTIHLIENYYLSDKADWVADDFEKKLREEVAFVKPNLIGNPAPPLNVVDTLLQPFYIEQIDQPYLVLYFYDPDCGHCKKATKALKEAYDELTALGAEILGVCTVTDVDKWKEYIRKNNLSWLHAADPYNESRFRITYNVRSTPKIYILGPDRKIVAKQLEVSQLNDVIQRMQQ